jgi:carboxylesterase type B
MGFMLVIGVVCLFCLSFMSQMNARKFNLTSGEFISTKIEIDKIEVYKLINIPYAEVPYAFEKAVLKRPDFNRTSTTNNDQTTLKRCVGDAQTNYGNFQLPKNSHTTFDCLTINLYMPNSQTYKNGSLSVMFFVHGGSNAIGSSSFFDGSVISAFGDVLVAIPNYRLSVLGFFNSKVDNITGNYGLWDQLLALEWIHSNCINLGI